MNIPKLTPALLKTIEALTNQGERRISPPPAKIATPLGDEFLKSQEAMLGMNKPAQPPELSSKEPDANEIANFVAGLQKIMRK